MCPSPWFMKGKYWQFPITATKKPPKPTLFVHCCSSPALCIQLLHPAFPAPQGARLWAARAPSFPTPVDEFLSTLCTESSPSSLPALPPTIYGCTAQSRSHLCPSSGSSTGQSAPDCCCLHTKLCATASCKMAAPSPRNPGASQCRLSQNVQILRGEKFTQKYPNVSLSFDAVKSLNSKTLDRVEM